jgi:hypothetical protein
MPGTTTRLVLLPNNPGPRGVTGATNPDMGAGMGE